MRARAEFGARVGHSWLVHVGVGQDLLAGNAPRVLRGFARADRGPGALRLPDRCG
jgi:hypothetical protein